MRDQAAPETRGSPEQDIALQAPLEPEHLLFVAFVVLLALGGCAQLLRDERRGMLACAFIFLTSLLALLLIVVLGAADTNDPVIATLSKPPYVSAMWDAVTTRSSAASKHGHPEEQLPTMRGGSEEDLLGRGGAAAADGMYDPLATFTLAETRPRSRARRKQTRAQVSADEEFDEEFDEAFSAQPTVRQQPHRAHSQDRFGAVDSPESVLASAFVVWHVAILVAVFNAACLAWLASRSCRGKPRRDRTSPPSKESRPLISGDATSNHGGYAAWRLSTRPKRSLYLSDIEKGG